MTAKATSIDEYIANLPDDRKGPITSLRKAISQNLPKGFQGTLSYGAIGWVVPHTLYPDGYHCDPNLPLPFLSIASQKSHIALYHMGLYADAGLLEWFEGEWPRHSVRKLDMGKSCVRFKKPEDVPVALIGELASKMTPKQWIDLYERSRPAGK